MTPEDDLDLPDPSQPDVLTVPLDPDEEIDPDDLPLTYNEDDVNLVAAFAAHKDGKDALKKIVTRVIECRDSALRSSEKYRQDNADTWKLFGGWTPPKPPPFDFGNQPYVPILIENCTRHELRAYLELFGQWNDLVSVDPINQDDIERARVMSYHDNFQLRYEIPDFRIQQQRGLLMFFVTGDVISHSFWSDERCENRHEMLQSAEDILIPYVHTTTMPDLSDVPWRIEVLPKYRHEMKKMQGKWYGVEEILKGEAQLWQEESKAKLVKAMADLFGIQKPTDTKDAPYEVLWFEGWLELPGQSHDRFCQAVIEAEHEAVLSLRIWETEDWRDKQRYDRQANERAVYEKMHGLWQQSQDPLGLGMAAQGMGEELAGPGAPPVPPEQMQQIPEPPRPSWMGPPGLGSELPEPEPVRKVPISLYSHVRCIQSIKGSLGFGMGKLLTPLHKMASSAISAFGDAASLANGTAYFAPANAVINDGKGVRIAPGYVNTVDGILPDTLDKALKEIAVAPANDQLLQLADKFRTWGEDALHSNAVMSGAEGKSGETYRGLATRVEQAGKPLSAMASIYWDFVVEQLKNNAFLNSIYLPEETIKSMVDALGARVTQPIRREWWSRDYRVTPPRNGLRFVSDAEKIAEADEERAIIEQTPELRQNPLMMKYVLEEQFKSRGCFELAKLVGPAMMQSMQMPQPGTEQPPPGGPGAQQARPPAPPSGGMNGRSPAAEAGAAPV